MSRLNAALSALALISALASDPAAAAQRVFVASFGTDANTANNCSFANPCRSFTAAMTIVDSGGEVVALDAAGYGTVTITKSVTITANPGFYAGISASTGSAVTIATAGVNVILRGLNINSVGATNGVDMTNGNRLSIENCVLSNFATGNAVNVTTAAAVRIVDSTFRDNSSGVWLADGTTTSITGSKFMGHTGTGIVLLPTLPGTTSILAVSDTILSGNTNGLVVGNTQPTATARAAVTRSTSANNYYGFYAWNNGGTTVITVSNTQVTGSGAAAFHNAGSTFNTLGNNALDQNALDYSGTITTIAAK
jgi:hypothetical protein